MSTHSQHINDFCSQHGLRLNTNLGQHFLVDQDVLNTIVESAQIQHNDHVLEIGAGIGILTKELLTKTQMVTTIELDERLIPLLKIYVHPAEPEIIHGNALHIPFPSHPYKIVANIPYHITSPLLRHAFLESEVAPTTITLLIQREVAEKITSKKSAGLLTILVQLFGKPTLLRTVPPRAFLPPPKVDSAVLHIECFAQPLADRQTIDEIFSLTKTAFSQKRKMLRNSIDPNRLARAGIAETRRPQTLTIEEWITLARCL